MKDIISKIKLGDKNAFQDLYRIYYPKIHSFICKVSKDGYLADEITQEVFFRLWVNRSSLDETMSYDSYFFTIAKNISMDIYRKNAVAMNYRNSLPSENVEPFYNETASNLNFSDLQKLIDEAIDKMPPQQQLVFRLSRTDGLLNEEIARKMGISKRTVEKHISNSLKTIKVIVKNNYMLFFA